MEIKREVLIMVQPSPFKDDRRIVKCIIVDVNGTEVYFIDIGNKSPIYKVVSKSVYETGVANLKQELTNYTNSGDSEFRTPFRYSGD